jgi:hypothetical protein
MATLFGIVTPFGGVSALALPGRQATIDCVTPEPETLGLASLDTATPIARASASPKASPVASPVGQTEPEVIATQISDATALVARCQTQRRMKILVELVDERFLADFYAGGGAITKAQFLALSTELPRLPVKILSVTDVRFDGDRGATAVVESTAGHQLFRARWSYEFREVTQGDETGEDPGLGNWIVTDVATLPVIVPDDANVTRVKLDEYRYDPKNLRVNGPNVVISATNDGEQDHEVLVLQLAGGVKVDELLRAPGPSLPDGFTVVGQLTIPAGERGQLVLVGMRKGDYAIVDLLPDTNGTPHMARGMKATLTIVR